MTDKKELTIIKDGIYDAYYDLRPSYFGREMGIRTRKRVNYIASNAKGNNILDIGCSQGITCMLLGREGKTALGIDISESTINEANEFLSREQQSTIDKVTFQHLNFMTNDFEAKAFDTIIITEVLEHLINPDVFVKKALDLLDVNQRIIITVPFGFSPFIDHKRTYYISGLLKLLNENLKIIKFEIIEDWACLIMDKTDEKQSLEIQNFYPYLDLVEEYMEKKEITLTNTINSQKKLMIKNKE